MNTNIRQAIAAGLLLLAGVCALVIITRERVRPGLESSVNPQAEPVQQFESAESPGEVRKESTPREPSTPASDSAANRAPHSTNTDLFIRIRLKVLTDHKRALGRGGAHTALDSVLTLLSTSSDELEERVQRAYALRLLPDVARRESSLRKQVLDILRNVAGTDHDMYARHVAIGTLFGHTLFFSQESESSGFWFAHKASQAGDSHAEYDRAQLDLNEGESALLSHTLHRAYEMETNWHGRQLIVRGLGALTSLTNVPFLCRASADAEESIRYWALAGLSTHRADPKSTYTLKRAMENDPSERNRLAAALFLVDQGKADDTVATRLLAARDKEGDIYEALGKLYSQFRSSSVRAFLERSLTAEAPSVRISAIAAIAASQSTDFVPALTTASQKETDGGVKEQFLIILASLNAKPKD